MRIRISKSELKMMIGRSTRVHTTHFYLFGFIQLGKAKQGYATRRSLNVLYRWLTRIEYEV